MSYRQKLWTHRPLTDFWRVGRGYAAKLEAHGLYTMGDIARCSIGRSDEVHNEELLLPSLRGQRRVTHRPRLGLGPCTIADVKSYKPENKSIVSGQVLQCPYGFEKSPAGGAGDGGRPGAGSGGQGAGHRPANPHSGI